MASGLRGPGPLSGMGRRKRLKVPAGLPFSGFADRHGPAVLRRQRTSRPREPSSGGSPRAARVLVIDDEMAICRSLRAPARQGARRHHRVRSAAGRRGSPRTGNMGRRLLRPHDARHDRHGRLRGPRRHEARCGAARHVHDGGQLLAPIVESFSRRPRTCTYRSRSSQQPSDASSARASSVRVYPSPLVRKRIQTGGTSGVQIERA